MQHWYELSKIVASWVAIASTLVVTISMGAIAHYRIGELATRSQEMDRAFAEMTLRNVQMQNDISWIRRAIEKQP